MLIQLKGIKNLMQPTCGIEYAHIYTDKQFGYEQLQSIQLLMKLEKRLSDGALTRRIILIDDYSPRKKTYFNIESFINQLAEHNAAPDVLMAESALEPYCDSVVDMIVDLRLQRSLKRYYHSRKNYPCSLFIAVWYLLRLGVFGRPELPTLKGIAQDLYTDSIVTILPDKFVKPEQMASEIIRKTGFHQALNAINVVYFDLDTVAIHGRISSLSSCTTYGASTAPVSAGLFFK